jgi:hypothetical protein
MDNCITFAFKAGKYRRERDHLVIRKSHWGWFPHVALMIELEGGYVIKREFIPDNPRLRWLPPLFFKGHVKTTFYKELDCEDLDEHVLAMLNDPRFIRPGSIPFGPCITNGESRE